MDYDETLNPSLPFANMNRRSIMMLVITGIITAVALLVIGEILRQYIIGPALCRGATTSACTDAPITSYHIASVISAILGVILLVNSNIYRPLLIAIAVTLVTWGLHPILLHLPWYQLLGGLLISNTISYLTFAWILRLYNFIFALILTTLVILGTIAITLL